MHCVEKYSLDCGIKSASPHVERAFFPQPYDKYIIIENSKRAPAAEYGHIGELLTYIHPYLRKHNITPIQIKLNPTDEEIPKCKIYERLTFGQINYLIENSELVISNDYYIPAIAGALNKKTISLHGIFPQAANSPIWGTEKHISIEPAGEKYLLNENAAIKYIDKIYPEAIAQETLKALEITSSLNKIEPIFCGSQFVNKTIEVIPDFEVTNDSLCGDNINIRADYHFNELNIAKLISRNKTNLITKQLISEKYLDTSIIKENLVQINYEVDLSTQQRSIDKLLPLGCEVNLFSKSEKDIQQIRLNLIDHEVELEKPKTKKELDIGDKICDNTCYKSSKIIISNNKHFSSKAKWAKDQPLQRLHFENIIDEDSFWEEVDHFKLFNVNVS